MKNHFVARLANPDGSALVVSLFVLLVLSLIAITSVKTSNTEISIAGNNVRRSQAVLASEAGLARTESVLRSLPKQVNADTLMSIINAATTLPNASYQVSMESGLPFRKVVAIGTASEANAAIQVTYQYSANPYNIWNNALFAGHGQDGKSINGNTGVHGSVHILGNGEPYQDQNGNGTRDTGEPYTDANHDGSYDPPLASNEVALDMSGSAEISNNYDGLAAPLLGRLPALAPMPYGGETVQSLMAELRVQHGQVALGGSATVGQPNVTGGSPAIKETMEAAWVTDGYTGSAASGAVYTDVGYEEEYDLDDLGPLMPNLDLPYTDGGGVTHSTYMNYLKSKAVVVSGDLKIHCPSSLPPIGSGANYLSTDASGYLVGQGIIYVQGNIEITGTCPVQYDGRFTLVSEGDVMVDADFYSKGTFATDDMVGVVSHGEITFGDKKSQMSVSGAFFAQEKVTVFKQTALAGTLVSNLFNMTQVPDLYQVPSLASNLSPGMPGAEDVYRYSWRRVPKSWTELY